jgi:hypothetical protein
MTERDRPRLHLVASEGPFPFPSEGESGDRPDPVFFTSRDWHQAVAAYRWTASRHEASHCVVALALGLPVRGAEVTDYDGTIWFDDRHREPPTDADLVDRVASAPMPPLFESWEGVAVDVVTAHAHCVTSCAALEGELLFADPARAAGNSLRDVDQAKILAAAFVARSPSSVDSYIQFARAEARGILTAHADTVIALADALIARRSLDRAEIDQIIALASGDGPR